MTTLAWRLLVSLALIFAMSLHVAAAQEEMPDESAPTDAAPEMPAQETEQTQPGPAAPTQGSGPSFSRPLVVTLPAMPAMPAIPAIPQMPDMSGMPDLSNLPGMPAMPGVPGMPPQAGPAPAPSGPTFAMPATGADDPCASSSGQGRSTGTAAPGAAPTTPPPPPPRGFLLVLLTNNSAETQTYQVTARNRAGAEIATSIAPFVPPGKSAIPIFVFQNDPPQPADVAFTAQPMALPVPPCLSNELLQARLEFGPASVAGSTVQVPVTNLDPTAYTVSLQAGLLQGDQLVAVADGQVSLPASGSQTAQLTLTFPFDVQAAPAHSGVVPALIPFGVRHGR